MSFGLSWKNWIGWALEGAASPYVTIGGGGAAAPLHFLPINGAESVKSNGNMLFSPTVEGVSRAPMKHAFGAITVGGTIPSCLIPGMFGASAAGKLYAWACRRYDITTAEPVPVLEEDQLVSATVWIKLATSNVVKKVVGAKVGKFTIESPEGGAYAGFSMDIIGRSLENLTTDPAITAAQVLTDLYGAETLPVPEYRTLDAKIRIGAVNAAPWASTWTGYDPDNMSWTVAVDNKLVEDGHRQDGTGLITRLYSTGREVTGSLGRDLRNYAEYHKFLAGTELSLALLLARGTSDLLVSLPRIVYEEGDPTSEGTREAYNKQALTFRALGSYNASPWGLGSEIEIAETV